MKQDNMPQVARFWNTIADEFDAIYTGANKSGFSRFLDRFFRKDIYQRFDWVMQKCGDVRGKTDLRHRMRFRTLRHRIRQARRRARHWRGCGAGHAEARPAAWWSAMASRTNATSR